ncbi:PP2C family protein-serine/threonine phosphatase [Angustibacter aerolatus]
MDQPVRRRWLLVGLAVQALLVVVDLVAGRLTHDPSRTNLTGTLALAPALTAVGGTRRNVSLVGLVGVVLGVLLSWLDDVPAGAGAIRTTVVVLGTVIALAAADTRMRSMHQLRDRRATARILQGAMLTELPQPDHLELRSRYVTATAGDQVGGDWYDGVISPDGATTVVIGDVTGHSISAAASMGQLRSILRGFVVDHDEPPAAQVQRLDRAVAALGLDVLATLVVLRVELPDPAEPDARQVRWCNAGHPPPLLLRPDGRVERLLTDAEPLLGLDPATRRTDHVAPLPVGSTLLLYTDGLVERAGADIDDGIETLAGHLAGRSAVPVDLLLDTVFAGLVTRRPPDDVAVLALRAHPHRA